MKVNEGVLFKKKSDGSIEVPEPPSGPPDILNLKMKDFNNFIQNIILETIYETISNTVIKIMEDGLGDGRKKVTGGGFFAGRDVITFENLKIHMNSKNGLLGEKLSSPHQHVLTLKDWHIDVLDIYDESVLAKDGAMDPHIQNYGYGKSADKDPIIYEFIFWEAFLKYNKIINEQMEYGDFRHNWPEKDDKLSTLQHFFPTVDFDHTSIIKNEYTDFVKPDDKIDTYGELIFDQAVSEQDAKNESKNKIDIINIKFDKLADTKIWIDGVEKSLKSFEEFKKTDIEIIKIFKDQRKKIKTQEKNGGYIYYSWEWYSVSDDDDNTIMNLIDDSINKIMNLDDEGFRECCGWAAGRKRGIPYPLDKAKKYPEHWYNKIMESFEEQTTSDECPGKGYLHSVLYNTIRQKLQEVINYYNKYYFSKTFQDMMDKGHISLETKEPITNPPNPECIKCIPAIPGFGLPQKWDSANVDGNVWAMPSELSIEYIKSCFIEDINNMERKANTCGK